jgi:uncharacterized repeat protein (TIGR01451 family)
MLEEAQPLPPFEDVPSRTGGESPSSFPERTPERTPGRTPSSSPVCAVEKLRPQLTIEKKAPESATIGIAHEYRIIVSNDGDTAARDVVVEDELNGAAEFVSSNPPADYDRNSGVILWNFDELAPQESREIVVRVRPTGEGMLTGTATVRFRTEVRSATLIRGRNFNWISMVPNRCWSVMISSCGSRFAMLAVVMRPVYCFAACSPTPSGIPRVRIWNTKLNCSAQVMNKPWTSPLLQQNLVAPFASRPKSVRPAFLL